MGQEEGFRFGIVKSSHPHKGKFGIFIRSPVQPGFPEMLTDMIPCPYGQPGDRLYVRETWASDGTQVWYRADADHGPASDVCEYPNGAYFEGKWKPSIHMPRWASRILLEITDARVERLQDISDGDIAAEGVAWNEPLSLKQDDSDTRSPAQRAFKRLWNSINAQRGYSWASNPWVWVIKFQKITP